MIMACSFPVLDLCILMSRKMAAGDLYQAPQGGGRRLFMGGGEGIIEPKDGNRNKHQPTWE